MLLEVVSLLRKRWITVVALAAIVVAAAAVITASQTPEYTARTRLFFAVPSGDSVADLAQGSSFTENQMSSYAQVATSPLVLSKVAEDLQLHQPGELAGKVAATVSANTAILDVTASAESPELAAGIANGVATRLASVVSTLYPTRTDGSQAVLATSLSQATPPLHPSSPNTTRNLSLSLLLGIALGVLAAFAREALDTKIRLSSDVEEITSSPLLGTVAFDQQAAQHPIAMTEKSTGMRAEAIRRLRTNLQFLDAVSTSRAILVTSSVASEGKTTTITNLAVALADAGSRVLLIDADLRRPSIHGILGLEEGAGLTSVLIGRASATDVIQPALGGRIDVLTSGPLPPNPSELLGSAAMTGLLSDVRSRYDVVLLDSPPVLPVTDAAVLSKRTDGTLLVVAAGRTYKTQLRGSLKALNAVGANVLGVILNKVDNRRGKGHDSYAYYHVYDQREQRAATGVQGARKT